MGGMRDRFQDVSRSVGPRYVHFDLPLDSKRHRHGLLVLFRERLNHQGRLAKELATDVYTVYLIHPVVLVGFAYAFHVVTLYPLLKWGIAVVVTIPLCFLISSGVRRIPLVNRVL